VTLLATPPVAGATTARAIGGYCPGLDGLRGLAVVGVLAFHHPWSGMPGGFLGVSLFFTLSGYLITALLLEEVSTTGRVDLTRFWARRFRRLLPAALLGVAVAIAAAAILGEAPRQFAGQVIAACGYVINWFFIAGDESYLDLFQSPSPLEHYWSLAIEEQFYVVMPLLATAVAFAARRRSANPATVFVGFVVVATAVSVVLVHSLRTSGVTFDRIYQGTDTRAAEILIGAVAASIMHRFDGASRLLHMPRSSRAALGVVGIVSIGVLAAMWATVDLDDERLFRWMIMLHALASTMAIVAVVSRSPILSDALSIRPLVVVGRLSYGVYVYHWPLFLVFDEDFVGIGGPALFAVRVTATIALAAASYAFVEQPIRRGWSPSFRRGSASLPIAAAIISIVALLSVSGAVVADRYPAAATAFEPAGSSLGLPVAAPDGRLDILIIRGPNYREVTDAVIDLAEPDSAVEIVSVSPFACDNTKAADCGGLVDDWAALIQRFDPDAVLLAIDGSAEALQTDPAEVTQSTVDAIREGISVLADNGAPVLWVNSFSEGAGFEELSAVHLALGPIAEQTGERFGLRQLRLVRDSGDPQADAAEVLDMLGVHHRGDRDGLQKVMVVGDSQARSLGSGLEQWALDVDRALVWNAAIGGCGLPEVGQVRFGGNWVDPCPAARDTYVRGIQSFDPDVVIVLSSVWDLLPRRLDAWPGAKQIGDPEFRDFLRTEYENAVGYLSAGGARVVWIRPACTGPDWLFTVAETDLVLLDQEIITPIVEASASVSRFDLGAILCTDGTAIRRTDDGLETRPDGIHFSPESSLWFAETYGDELLAE